MIGRTGGSVSIPLKFICPVAKLTNSEESRATPGSGAPKPTRLTGKSG
jgi:hypothetical protein